METAKCIVWDVSPIIVEIGPLAFRWYGVLFALVFIIGYQTLVWQFVRGGYKQEEAMRILIYCFFGMLIGAYFGHRIFYDWKDFINNPLSAFDIRGGIRGLSSHGATVGLLIATYLFSRKTGIRYMEVMDRIVFGVGIGATNVRIGNFFNSEIVGRETSVAWAFCFPRHDRGELVPRHPSQLYETAIGLFTLGMMFAIDRWAGKEKRPLGLLLGSFMAIYFSLRFFVEFFKEYQALTPQSSSLTMGQYLSLPFIFTGIFLLWRAFKKREPASMPPKPSKASSNKKRGK